MWAEELQHSELTRDMQQAEQLLRLHNESVTQMQNTTFQVFKRIIYICIRGRIMQYTFFWFK
jgi:hypothetical protein